MNLLHLISRREEVCIGVDEPRGSVVAGKRRGGSYQNSSKLERNVCQSSFQNPICK